MFRDVWDIFVSLLTCAMLLYGYAMTPRNYFTGWALLIFAIFFFTTAALTGATLAGFHAPRKMIASGEYAKWGFAPCLIISVAVAVTVLFFLWEAWESTWNEHCLVSKFVCREIMINFIVVHYFPPLALLTAKATLSSLQEPAAKHAETKQRLRYAVLLLQISTVPILVYGTFYNVSIVYGAAEMTSTALYFSSSVIERLRRPHLVLDKRRARQMLRP